MTILGSNQIGYSRSANGTTTFQSIDPRDNEPFSIAFTQATEEETDLALELAARAAPLFAKTSVHQRAGFMRRIADELLRNKQILIQHFSRESGLPADRAVTELTRTAFQLTEYAAALITGKPLNAVISAADPNRKPMARPDIRKVNQAIGPVAVFGASNFPFAYSTAGGDTASAFAAGCPVIVKAHSMHPATSELVATIIAEAARVCQLPEGVFSHLFATDYTIGEQLVLDSRVRAVGFTGSVQGGMALYKLANKRPDPIPVFAEMGSTNPVVVTSGAIRSRSKEIVKVLTGSVASNAGQFCTSPGILFIVRDEHTHGFLQELSVSLGAIEPQVMLHENIKANYEKSRDAQRETAQILLDPQSSALNSILPGLFSISGGTFLQTTKWQDEVFGAHLLVVQCSDYHELIGCLNFLRGQLTASLFFESAEHDLIDKLRDILEDKVGRIIFNGVPTGVEVVSAQNHGGPFPASTDSRFTAVGGDAILRWLKPVSYQNAPDELLPLPLKRSNPEGILRFVNEMWTTASC